MQLPLSGSFASGNYSPETRDGDQVRTVAVVVGLVGDGFGLRSTIAEKNGFPVDAFMNMNHITCDGEVFSPANGGQGLGDCSGIGVVSEGRGCDVPL